MKVDLPVKRYYAIGEVAKAFQVNTSLLRFWEKEFKEIQPKKKSSGIRKFTPKDVEVLELIYHLVKEKGMTIEGAKNYLRTNKNKAESKLALHKKLKNIKFLLHLIINCLKNVCEVILQIMFLVHSLE